MASSDEEKKVAVVEEKEEEKKVKEGEEKKEEKKEAVADPLQEFMEEGRKEKAASAPKPKVGDIYECRFPHPKGDRWFEAKVLEIIEKGGEEKYKMEWQYDPDEEKSVVPVSDLRFPPGKEPKEPVPEKKKEGLAPKVGQIFEARFAHPKGDRWFEAKVLEIIEKGGEEKYKMEWQYDPDEKKSILSVSDLRLPPGQEPAKKEETPKEETPKVGDIYEGRFAHPKGDRWFEAKVLEIVKDGGVEKYKMEWQYDPDEAKSVLPLADLRKVGSAKKDGGGKGGARQGGGGMQREQEMPEKRKAMYVVDAVEEEKRKKRAARFGTTA